MRLLILSEIVHRKQSFGGIPYNPPYDVQLHTGDLNEPEDFSFSVFDYDVSIIHITEREHHTIGYDKNIPRLLRDSIRALEHGRSVICLPHSANYVLTGRGRKKGKPVYEWLKDLGVELQDNVGEDIKPSGAGRAQVIQAYLKWTPKYYQVVAKPEPTPERRLAVVDDTEIVVGLEHEFGKGTLVILPPPNIHTNSYLLTMSDLVRVARRYYERAQRRIPVDDAPDWVERYLVARAKYVDDQISKLAAERETYDRLAYLLYGTGHELEDSVALLLGQLGLEVALQPPGANIDLKAKHSDLKIGFAVEVTGTKGMIQKDSKKVVQAWQYLNDRVGTSEEDDKLVIAANTQRHLDPEKRHHDSFSLNVVRLLGDNDVLLITTSQLYEQWKEVHEGRRSAKDLVQELYSSSGLYQSTSS